MGRRKNKDEKGGGQRRRRSLWTISGGTGAAGSGPRKGDDRNQGQNEAEEAKTKAGQGGKEKRQGQQKGEAKTNTVQRISRLSGAAKRVETQTLPNNDKKDNTHK